MRELTMQNGTVWDVTTTVAYCPVCEQTLSDAETAHCGNCGTAVVRDDVGGD